VTRRRLKVVDLFAGCGGLSFGFELGVPKAHVTHVAAVELDPEAAATYAHNVSRHIFVGDIAAWIGSTDVPAAGCVDVVLGGPPCQGFSALGKQDVHDQRNGLWDRYVAAVNAMAPAVFVLENVPQFLLSEQFSHLRAECRSRGRLSGYTIEFAQVLDASLYGAAQRRKRAIVVGRRSDIAPFGLPPQVAYQVTVRDALAGLTLSVTDTDLPPSEGVHFDGRQIAGPYLGEDIHVTRWRTDLSLKRYRAIPPGGNRFNLPVELQTPCWRKHRSGAGDVMGRLHWDRPSVTIRTEFFKPEKGRYLHPSEDRPITHFEAARLQGFPDDFQWFGSKVSIARQIGNAVPIPLGAALGSHVGAALLDKGRRGSRAA
jgi:DNA (cytosine-5)-methyltransferase 1